MVATTDIGRVLLTPLVRLSYDLPIKDNVRRKKLQMIEKMTRAIHGPRLTINQTHNMNPRDYYTGMNRPELNDQHIDWKFPGPSMVECWPLGDSAQRYWETVPYAGSSQHF